MHPTPTLSTLDEALQQGRLRPIVRQTAMRILSVAEHSSPGDVRAIVMLLLQRVRDYYEVVEYCAPDTSRVNRNTDYPCALSATPSQSFSAKLSVDHPAEGPAMIWREAGFMCIKSAISVAAWEFTKLEPEAATAIRYAKLAAYGAAITSKGITGKNWTETRGRIKKTGAIRLLETALQAIPDFWFALNGNNFGSFLGQHEYERRLETPGVNGLSQYRLSPPMRSKQETIQLVMAA